MVQIHTVSSGFSSGFTLPRIKDIVLIGNRHIGMLPKWPPGPFLWPLHGGIWVWGYLWRQTKQLLNTKKY